MVFFCFLLGIVEYDKVLMLLINDFLLLLFGQLILLNEVKVSIDVI